MDMGVNHPGEDDQTRRVDDDPGSRDITHRGDATSRYPQIDTVAAVGGDDGPALDREIEADDPSLLAC